MIQPHEQSQSLYSEFFSQLVSEGVRDILYDSLTSSIGHPDFAWSDNPYEHLRAGLEALVLHAAMITDDVGGGFEREVSENKLPLDFGIAALARVGNIYQQNATAAQHHEKVRDNAYSAVRYVHDGVLYDRISTGLSIVGWLTGRDPATLQLGNKGQIPEEVQDMMHENAFTHTVDDDEQLTIRPTYPLRDDARGYCPAARDIMKVGNKHQPSLLTLMQVTADVAVNRIYPEQFAILPQSRQ